MIRALPLAAFLVLFGNPVLISAGPAPNPYAAIDRHALRATPVAEQSIEALARYLVAPAKNKKEKTRAIYRWITDRIAYDVDSYFAGKHPDTEPEKVLKARKAICGGYASLYKELCQQAGIKAVIVQGKTKGYGFIEGDSSTTDLHGWNAVEIDDEWYLVDSTWGSGGLKDRKFVKNFRDFYYMPPPEALAFTHFPRKENCQLLDSPLTEKEFDRQPRVSARFFEVGIKPSAIRETINAADFSSLVKIYDVPGKSFLVKKAPLSESLTAGSRHELIIETTDFPSVVVSSGDRTFPLTRSGKQFKGTIVAPRGTIKVQGLVGQGRKIIIWGLLEYEGK